MNEYWFCCEDLNRDVEYQHVAFGPFKTQREAKAFGWALAYADTDNSTYCSFKVLDDAGIRVRVFINPQEQPVSGLDSADPDGRWERLTAYPGDEPYNEHDDSAYQCGKGLLD